MRFVHVNGCLLHFNRFIDLAVNSHKSLQFGFQWAVVSLDPLCYRYLLFSCFFNNYLSYLLPCAQVAMPLAYGFKFQLL